MSRTGHEAAIWRPAQASGCVRSLSYDYPNGHEVLSHVHHHHQLVYAVQGVMTVSADRGSWIVPAHRGVWVPAHVEHAIRMSGAVSMRTLYLDPRIVHGLSRECRVVDVPPLLREIILRAVEHGSLDRRVPAQRHLVDVLLDEVRALPSRALHVPRPADPRARRLVEYVERDPAPRRPLGRLARTTGASPRTLQRLFRRETGMTVGNWRRQLRLARSLETLAGGSSVTAAAFDAGYQSVSAFVSVFRRTFGETPGRYFRAPATRELVARAPGA
jgi:AraC-like DNA-binding protein